MALTQAALQMRVLDMGDTVAIVMDWLAHRRGLQVFGRAAAAAAAAAAIGRHDADVGLLDARTAARWLSSDLWAIRMRRMVGKGKKQWRTVELVHDLCDPLASSRLGCTGRL